MGKQDDSLERAGEIKGELIMVGEICPCAVVALGALSLAASLSMSVNVPACLTQVAAMMVEEDSTRRVEFRVK